MEYWKDLIGFENKYSISNYGRLCNKQTNHIYKLTNKNGDYIRVRLYDKTHKETRLLHRMVAIAFLPNPNNLPEIDHIDLNKQNNNVNNLRWVSRKENINHNINKNNFFFISEYNKKKVWKDVIYQYDLNMNYINKYNNSKIAEKKTGVCSRNILQCCNHREGRKQAGGYKWFYESEVVINGI